MALSETPYLFFLLVSLNLISKSIREGDSKHMLIAGLSISIASGFRYEAWLLMAAIGFFLLFIDWKKAFLYGATALIFPIAWMISNWSATGDLFYSIQGNYTWTLEVMGNNDNLDAETMLRRIWFFPFSWFISVGPPVAFLLLINMVKCIKPRPRNRLMVLWFTLFFTMLLFFIYNSINGVLLLQHRFIGTLVVLSLPFIALSFGELHRKTLRNAWVFGGLTLGLSFIYNTSGVTPLPRLGDQDKAQLSDIIHTALTPNSALILDFVGWDYTYYYALHSRLPQNKLIIVQGAKNAEFPLQAIYDLVTSQEHIVIVMQKESEYRSLFFEQLPTEDLHKIAEYDDVEIYEVNSSE
ncbi:MAG: hypothetical protein JKY09_03995 [Crocinitomicaceae bacterium]|nr:hypothetical protein [Crocinitomicaceae bacterium]